MSFVLQGDKKIVGWNLRQGSAASSHFVHEDEALLFSSCLDKIRQDKITLLSQLRNYNVVCDEQLHNIVHVKVLFSYGHYSEERQQIADEEIRDTHSRQGVNEELDRSIEPPPPPPP